jgi:hypothetical protein
LQPVRAVAQHGLTDGSTMLRASRGAQGALRLGKFIIGIIVGIVLVIFVLIQCTRAIF